MNRWRRLAGAIGCLVSIAPLAACGKGSEPPQPLAVDEAFVTRIVPHQHTALALVDRAATRARGRSVRRLARGMRSMRMRTLPALDERLTRISQRVDGAALGVSARQAADEVTPTALDASRSLETAFLTIMARHDHGALALATAELQRGRDPAVKASAQRLAAELTRELAQLDGALVALARRARR